MQKKLLLSLCFFVIVFASKAQQDSIAYHHYFNHLTEEYDTLAYRKISYHGDSLIVQDFFINENAFAESPKKKRKKRKKEIKPPIKWLKHNSEKAYFIGDSIIKFERIPNSFNPYNTAAIRRYKKLDGYYKFRDYSYHGNRILEGTASALFPLKLEGRVLDFFVTGELKSKAIYKNNKQISGRSYNKDGSIDSFSKPIDHTKLLNFQTMPQFKGGDKVLQRFITDNLQYPLEARNKNIEGRVFVTFTIGKDGEISNMSVLRGVHPLLDNEAIRIVKLSDGHWIPALSNEGYIESGFNLPIRFVLEGVY